MRQVSHLLMADRPDSALQELEGFIRSGLPPEILHLALAMSASVKEQCGDLSGAKSDLHVCLDLVGASFSRHVAECALGAIYEKEGNRDTAIEWYRKALRTSLEGQFSSGAALASYLRLHKESVIDSSDLELCTEAVRASWRILQIEGSPQVTDLNQAAEILADCERRVPPAGGAPFPGVA